MKLSHIAFRVPDLDEAIKHWQMMGFALDKRFTKSDPEAAVAWLLDEAGKGIELWQYTNEKHPKSAHRARHMAFLSDDIHKDAEILTNGGFKETTPYTKGKLFNYMFFEDSFGMAFELLEEK